ncbi:hypothetical protein HIM_04063 [Hirsutella minnesotensis 3608]|uniref:GRF-type domain-containing protein n=1 Tax=Hirsutella minnesotensis 3608 TaxID=1043627 RepID=A0A0F8A251_9HYPO|nr:hypothetical protein HIM_04063 [Hirsutella minnesotensis 3608]
MPRGARRRRSGPDVTSRAQFSDKKRLDGLWQNQVWWCNCEPRNEAALREVKKRSPNKGRWFWTCQTRSCDFFLWRDDAVLRETDSKPDVVGAQTPVRIKQEPPAEPAPRTPTLTQRPLTSYGVLTSPVRPAVENAGRDSLASHRGTGGNAMPASTSTLTPSQPNSSKRGRDVFEHDDAEFSDFGSDDEMQLVAIADKSAEKPARQANALATPTPNRLNDEPSRITTPSVARTLFAGPDPKRQKTVSFEERPGPGLPTPAKGARRASALRTRGIAMGRDKAREALREKEDKIAQLQERVADLENKAKSHSSQMANIKANLMKMYQDN